MVTIYADTLVFINVFVTYFLLLATQMLCRRELRRLRLLAAGALGGAYALTILLPPMPLVVSVLLRAAVCILLQIIADGVRSVRQLTKGTLVFLAVNCVFAGLMLLLQMLRPQRLLYSAGVVYFDVSVPFILLSTLLAFGVLQLCLRLASGRHARVPHGTVTIRMGEKSVQCVGILDTGHHLSDPFTGKPVVIVSVRRLRALVPDAVFAFLGGKALADCGVPPDFVGRLRLFPCRTVDGSGLLPAFRCTGIRIECGTRVYERDDIYIAAADNKLAGGDYDALFSEAVYDAMEGEETYAVQNDLPQGMAASSAHAAVRSVGAFHRLRANAAAAARKKRRGGRTRTASRRG